MTSEFKELREAFGLFATGVCLATTSQDNQDNFITVNSLSSISLDPALLLFSIDNKSSNFSAFTQNDNFAINLLTQDQIDISKIFSGKLSAENFNIEQNFSRSKNNNLILKDSLGYFECKKHQIIPAGDHHIIMGAISNFSKINSDQEPLLYYKGDYK
jgi:flavin-dependent trigonelline monooxygenase, reductase component